MKNQSARWVLPVWLCLGGVVAAQEQRPPTSAVEGVKGVKQDAVESVKKVEPGTASSAQGVNKINGVKADGRAVVPPANPPPPPPVSPVAPPPVNPVAPPPVTAAAPRCDRPLSLR